MRAYGKSRYLLQSQPFPAQKHFNSLSASSTLAPSPQIQTRPDYQHSVSAGSAALLTRSAPLTQSQCAQLQLQAESLCQRTQYAHLPGASAPYATLTRAETYTPPPAAGRSVPPRSPPHAFQVPAHAQQQQRPVEFKCSVSAMGVYHAHEHEDHPARPSGDFKRSASVMGMLGNANTMGRGSEGGSSLSALVGSGIVLGAPASTLGRVPTPTLLSRTLTPVPGPRSGMPQPQPTGFLAVPGAANSIGMGAGRDKEKDQASIALHAMRSVRSMAQLWDGEEGEKKEKEKENGEGEGMVRGKKEKEGKEKKVKVKVKAKEEAKEKEKKGKRLPKSSGSSFEVGALGASPVQRKRSILGLGLGSLLSKSGTSRIGLGLPSALSLGRNSTGAKGSTASSVFIAPPPASTSTTNTNGLPSSLSSSQSSAAPNPNRLSAESANRNVGRESTNSSLRPLSVLSSGSSAGCSSRASSGSSIRWAEEVVDRVRGQGRDSVQREERERAKESKKAERESRRTSEGRKRMPLSDVFPGLSRRSSAASGASRE
ncbi:hypothetical protein B0H14DRAFT_3898543 [Mycena olivaceomarginata]|nr:hypothetical protein B0H14DRAFT_3898543 [Mycena olivaceomarginata]